MVSKIDELAVIDPKARIGEGVAIGPFSVIGPDVTIGDGCVVGSGASIISTRMGPGCQVGPNTAIGGDPQIIDWRPVRSWVAIGSNVKINELATIHRSMYENGETIIGDNSYIMAQSHIGHDCKLGEGVVMTSLAGFSGHVEVGKYAVIGGAAVAHQYVRIGEMAMVGGLSRLVQDAPPYFTVSGVPAVAVGLNSYALKKHNIPPAQRANLKKAYKILVRSGTPFSEAVERVINEIPTEGAVGVLVEFLKKSKRGVTL